MDDEGVQGKSPAQDRLLEEASLWFARMRGPDADAYRSEFERWLSAGAAHRGAYNRAGEVFALGKFLAETPDAHVIDARNRADPRPRWMMLSLAASLLLLVATGTWLWRDLVATHLGGSPAATAAGQKPSDGGTFTRLPGDADKRRQLVLVDGSKVTLEAGAVLATRFDMQQRLLRLERGRARFEVAHEARPFVVLAGGGSVTARGTIFDVIVDEAQRVTVRLLRGAVDVARPTILSEASSDSEIVTRLAPGETLNFGAGSSPGLAAHSSNPALPQSSVPDENEIMEFEKAPMSEIVAQANLGSGRQIVLADPALADLRVSGRFRIENPEQVAERLAALFNLKMSKSENGDVVLRAP